MRLLNTALRKKIPYGLFPFVRTTVCSFFIIAALPFAASAVSADETGSKNKSTIASYQDIQLFANALTYLQRVSEKDIDQKKYLYTALQSMTEALDRYSYFVPPDLIGLFHEVHKNKWIGVGIQIARSSGGSNLEIISIENDSPAQRANLEPGDHITAIDGKSTREMRLVDAIRAIRSPGQAEGSKVTLSILKAGNKNSTDVSLARTFIKPAVIRWKVLQNRFGYINVISFNKSTVPDFKKAIEEMETAAGKLKGVIIDLRNNAGGEVDASVDLARLFIDEGIIASLRNRLDDVNTVYRANMTRLYHWPAVILIGKGTASAAELFAGALQVHKKATAVGSKTFGKGVFQSLVPLSNDSGLYITLGPYYLPDGRSVEGAGLTPDVLLKEGVPEDVIMSKSLDILMTSK